MTRVTERHPHPKYSRLSIQLRTDSKFYQAVTYLDGKLRQSSTKTTHFPTALKLAEDWYKRETRASVAFGRQHPIQQLTSDPTMGELYRSYFADLPTHQQPYATMKWNPQADFWRARTLSTISAKTFQHFYAWRRPGRKNGKRPAVPIKNHTLHKDVVLIRQILKHAMDSELLEQLPHIPPIGKIEANPRPWFTPQEGLHLLKTAIQRIKDAPNRRARQQRQDVLDFMNFLEASMMRVGELRTLRFRSCRLEKNSDGDPMLLCEVTGKRGTRTVVAQQMAAAVYEARLKSERIWNGDEKPRLPKSGDLIFPNHVRDSFRELLEAAELRVDERGLTRNLKSLRATSISTMLLENPEMNLAIVARNAGTSVQMIDTFYAKRLTAEMNKDTLSALPAGLSVNKKKRKRR